MVTPPVGTPRATPPIGEEVDRVSPPVGTPRATPPIGEEVDRVRGTKSIIGQPK
jgi:hypothetical protein